MDKIPDTDNLKISSISINQIFLIGKKRRRVFTSLKSEDSSTTVFA